MAIKKQKKEQWDAYIKQFTGKETSPVRGDGAQILRERLESHLEIEGSNWQTIQVLQNDEETLDNQDKGPMLRRDESLKRKRLRKRWIRQWALDHKTSGVG